MKKFLGVLVAITLCVCMLAPAALAADDAALSDIFEGIDLGELNEADLAAIIEDLGLEDVDVDAVLGGDEDALANLEDSVKELEAIVEDEPTTVVSDVAAGLDLSWLTGLLGGAMDTTAITDMLGGLGVGQLDALLGTISGAFGGTGIELATLDLGADVAALASEEVAPNDMMATIMDTLFGGLESLGLDTSLIEGMLDNDIVNFFANMYIGFIGEVPEETTTAAPTTTTKPAVVTTKTPDTGDTSAVFAALATITVASAAAFVCLKKKED